MFKLAFLLVLSGVFSSSPIWFTNASDAFSKAHTTHQYVLLNFSGSDWCGPCVRLHDTFFLDSSFSTMAADNLVLLNADFPRQKKHRLSQAQQSQNDALAEKYNPNGVFPYTLLLDETGRVAATWEGVPKGSVADFVKEITSLVKKKP